MAVERPQDTIAMSGTEKPLRLLSLGMEIVSSIILRQRLCKIVERNNTDQFQMVEASVASQVFLFSKS